MERVGVHEYEAEPFIEHSLRLKHIDIEGIYTHLANSEATDLIHARLQLERFQEVLHIYEKRSEPTPSLRHMANSGAILQFPESYLDMVRPGIMFYGVYPRGVAHTIEVAPALTWKSLVAYSKRTRPGRPVSYGSLWQAEAETRIVTIPCGYGDGYFRRMTNLAQVIVNGKKYPQVGRICLDQFMVNVGDADVKVAARDGHAPAEREWRTYLGDDAASHRSPLDQIRPENVARLEIAWRYDAGGASTAATTQIHTNPLVVKGVLYGTSPALALFALDAATGEELWRFEPEADIRVETARTFPRVARGST